MDNLFTMGYKEMRHHFYPTESEKVRHGDALGETIDPELSIFEAGPEKSAESEV